MRDELPVAVQSIIWPVGPANIGCKKLKITDRPSPLSFFFLTEGPALLLFSCFHRRGKFKMYVNDLLFFCLGLIQRSFYCAWWVPVHISFHTESLHLLGTYS